MAFVTPNTKALKNISWKKLLSYFNPQSVKDLDQFLDKLPVRAGMNSIIVASIVWAIAGAALLFVYNKSVDIQEMRKELSQAEALRPTVPTLLYKPVDVTAVTPHIDKIKKIYPKLQIVQNGSDVKILSQSTRDFSAWRSAINDIAYGATSWRAKVKTFCAGRDCVGGPLQAELSIQELDITMPTVADEDKKS